MHTIIFANGTITDYTACQPYLRAADLIICADGGTAHARRMNVMPHLIIGDLDSLDAAERSYLEQIGVTFIQHPARKDETDLELALLYAVERGAAEITILGALGERIDQTLTNCFLLAMEELRGVQVKIVDAHQEIVLIQPQRVAAFNGHVGDTLSLLPLSPAVTKIYTTGLAYPLRDGTLYMGAARGVSNEFTAPVATVRVGEGLLLAVQVRGTGACPRRGESAAHLRTQENNE